MGAFSGCADDGVGIDVAKASINAAIVFMRFLHCYCYPDGMRRPVDEMHVKRGLYIARCGWSSKCSGSIAHDTAS